jgi:putative selenate reductase molybdopterin-binding subunit
VINPLAHQMQIDGGATMGFGYACLEDLDESEGQVWAANLGEFKLPSARDVPRFRTVKVTGGLGVGTANVKNIGESTTPPVPAAIANAVFDATGCRIRELPITAERIYQALQSRR